MAKRVAILGATGSIGTQTLEVIDNHPDEFVVEVLSAHSNVSVLVGQALRYQPNAVVITDDSRYAEVRDALGGTDIKVFAGLAALQEVVAWDSVDIVVTAIVGFAGLESTLAAARAGKHIALANKEALVVAGASVMEEAFQNKARIVPVDSEHSAIYQCLMGEDFAAIEKIILTASGGPFLGRKTNYLVNVKASHALEHPTYSMGAKISVDSATLMNKGLEMIEAKWLFGLQNDQISVVVHRQSIVHSLVQFQDGSLKAQLSLPDMRLPIQYALGWPRRLPNTFRRFDFKDFEQLTFEAPDTRTFRNLALAQDAMEQGGNMPAILNAANEVVVDAFLNNRVGFPEMSDMIEKTMGAVSHYENPTLEDLHATDAAARAFAAELVQSSQYRQ